MAASRNGLQSSPSGAYTPHDDTTAFFQATPPAAGESLRERLAREGELPLPEAVHVVRDILGVLALAHARGIRHHALSPERIVLAGGKAIVIHPSAGLSGGTAYLAPEQALGSPETDHRADLYALGVIAYEMLAGTHPFRSGTPSQQIADHAMQAPESLSARRASAPSALIGLVMQLLEKDPSRRPASAEDVLLTLDRTLTPTGGMPLIGVKLAAHHEDTPLERTARWFDWALHWRWERVPRHVAALLAGGVAVVIVVVGLARSGSDPGAAPTKRVVMVMPFDNAGPPERAYLADGISRAVAERLARAGRVEVIGSRTSARYRPASRTPSQVARDLGVTHLVTGTVRWEEAGGSVGRIAVHAELVRVGDSRVIWTQPYEADMADVFRVEAEIAQRVGQAVAPALAADEPRLERPPTTNLQAYDAYLRGRHLAATGLADSIRASVTRMEDAVRLDSAFALAWWQMGVAWASLADVAMPARAAVARARPAVARALALDSTIAGAHAQVALIELLHDWDPRAAAEAVQRALAANPHHPRAIGARGLLLLERGATDSAVTELRRALRLDPTDVALLRWTMESLARAGRPAEAVAEARRAASLLPVNDPAAALMLANAHALEGDFTRMRQHALAAGASTSARARLAYAEARMGRRDAARAILAQLRRSGEFVSASSLALVSSGLGDADSAILLLERARAERAADLVFLDAPPWEPLRADPRFGALQRRVGLPAR